MIGEKESRDSLSNAQKAYRGTIFKKRAPLPDTIFLLHDDRNWKPFETGASRAIPSPGTIPSLIPNYF